MSPSKQTKSLSSPAFIADCHLGKLAKYLRLMGYDTLFFSHIEDSDLIKLAVTEHRTILTRDRELSERKNAPVFFLAPTDTQTQLKTLIDYFGLTGHAASFSRCTVCNTPLEVIKKEKVIHRLPEGVKKNFAYFEHCPSCNRIYWHGDHYWNMVAFLEEIHDHLL